MISVIRTIIKTPEFSVITVMPPYSPAEALVEKAHQKALKRRDACRVAGDTDAEADSKIAQRNGKTVAQTLAEFFPIHHSQTFFSCFPAIIAQLLT